VPEVEELTTDVVYDLASLTKAVVTSLLVMRGVGSGIWGLDDPLDKHLPSLAARPEVTLRRTLAHAAGFAAHRPFFEQVIKDGVAPAQGRERIVTLAAAEPLAYQPGTRSLYSDLGFILLGDLVERGLGGRLACWPRSFCSRHLGCAPRAFPVRRRFPAETGAHRTLSRCAAHARGRGPRSQRLCYGGVAGHAGLFANAADLHELASALCAAGAILRPRAVRSGSG